MTSDRSVPMWTSSDSGDDPAFMDLVTRIISGELHAKSVDEARTIRIDNWFDHKWLNYSGKGRVAFGWFTGMRVDRDTALDEFHQPQKTFPPFSPDRIVEERCFERGRIGSYSPAPNASLIHSRVRAHSNTNLHRRVSTFSGSALYVWFSSNSRLNGRGSMMVYRADSDNVTSWYSSFSSGPKWAVHQTKGIGREQVRMWIDS